MYLDPIIYFSGPACLRPSLSHDMLTAGRVQHYVISLTRVELLDLILLPRPFYQEFNFPTPNIFYMPRFELTPITGVVAISIHYCTGDHDSKLGTKWRDTSSVSPPFEKASGIDRAGKQIIFLGASYANCMPKKCAEITRPEGTALTTRGCIVKWAEVRTRADLKWPRLVVAHSAKPLN